MADKKGVGLYQKIANIMKAVEYINKDDTVAFGNTRYKAMSEEKITTIYRQQFIEQGLVVFPIKQTTDVKEMYKKDKAGDSVLVGFLTTTNTDYKLVDVETGECEIISSSGQGVDSQDKGVGKAMTYSFKYLFFRTFAAATGDDPDKISSPEWDKIQADMLGKGDEGNIDKMITDKFPGAKVIDRKPESNSKESDLANDKDILELKKQAEANGKLSLKVFDALVRSYTPENKDTLLNLLKSKI